VVAEVTYPGSAMPRWHRNIEAAIPRTSDLMQEQIGGLLASVFSYEFEAFISNRYPGDRSAFLWLPTPQAPWEHLNRVIRGEARDTDPGCVLAASWALTIKRRTNSPSAQTTGAVIPPVQKSQRTTLRRIHGTELRIRLRVVINMTIHSSYNSNCIPRSSS
jgi:hypothetical protein